MLRPIQDLKWQEALPRMAADFIIVHLSMIGALAISVVYQTAAGHPLAARELTSDFSHYYNAFFWFLSPVIPLVFLLNGFYTHRRKLPVVRKLWPIARGVVLAVLIFFGLNVFFFGQSIEGRSVALPFVALASIGLVSVRLLTGLFEHLFDVRPRNHLLVSRERGRVLVIGGAGYIGSLLVERLLQSGYRVRVLDSLLYGGDALRPVTNHPGFELMVGDCRNIRDVVKAMRGIDSIVHLAAIVGDPACDQNREAALETNYAATRMLIEIAKGHGVSRLLFASSCSVYGAADVEMCEHDTVHPISLYGQTKVDSEQALLNARSETFHPTVLRFATVFGLSYRPRFDLVVNLLAAKAKQDGVITIYNGEQWRPFIHVRDVAEATLCVLEAPAGLVNGEIFNVGDKRLNYTLSQVAQLIREVFPNVRIEYTENADRRNYRANFQKLLDRTGFQAQYTLRQGIEELGRALDERLIIDYRDLRYHNQHYLKKIGTRQHKDDFDQLVMAAHTGTLHPLLNSEFLLRRFRDKLVAAVTPEECWEVLQQTSTEFGFQEIHLKMGDRVYRHSTNGHGIHKPWTVLMRIQLSDSDYLSVARDFETQEPPIAVRFSDVIGQILTAKISTMSPLTRRSEASGGRTLSRQDAKAQSATWTSA
jgi:nucleoside-diphosphate-sugar epimerase